MMNKVPLPLPACEATCRRIASTASELAAVYDLIQGCIGVDLFLERKVTLCEIADDLHRHLGLYCEELGIGTPKPQTDKIGAGNAESACPKCGRWPIRGCCREFGIGEPGSETTTEGDPVEEVEVDAGSDLIQCRRCGLTLTCDCADSAYRKKD